MNNLLSISVGIPAYNEEANIVALIETVRAQRTPHFMIKEIIVVSDGSTDRTADMVRGIDDSRVRLIERDTRAGQAQCQNEILGLFESDALVILEADTRIEDKDYLALLTYPLWRCTADLVFGLSLPQAGGERMERAFTLADLAKKRACMATSGAEFFLCHSGKALSRTFAKKMRFFSDAPEDALVFLKAKELGYRTLFECDAITYYRSPGTLMDYCRKYARFHVGYNMLQKHVTLETLTTYKQFPVWRYVSKLLEAGRTYPALIVMYLGAYVSAQVYARIVRSENALWEVSLSTKNLGRSYE